MTAIENTVTQSPVERLTAFIYKVKAFNNVRNFKQFGHL